MNGFTTKDRNMLIKTHTTVTLIREEHGRRLKELEKEDKALHHRINKVRNLFGGITATAGAVVAGIIGYFKLTKGG